ncbi:hypothetical protein BY458DRAFT_522316 [Sporodiniella umbellata]|nr:hypothetical protein BY458DRAFT_522316 [Sporodiniella umbellata]
MRRLTNMRLDTKEMRFAKQVVRCVFVTNNPIHYFRLYSQSPCLPYQWMMEKYHSTMRKRAIQTLWKSYLSVSLDWAKLCLGLNNKAEVESTLRSFADCIDHIDAEKNMVHFIKGNKKKVGL